MGLRDSGKVCIMRLDSVTDELVLILHCDLCTLIQGTCPEPLAHKVINRLLSRTRDTSISKDELTKELKFNGEDIR